MQRQGIEAAKEKNKYKDRKTVITKDLIKKVEKYKNLGVSVTEIGLVCPFKKVFCLSVS